jgi:hypothetical protein
MRRDDRLPQLMAAALLAGLAFVVSLELLWRERPAAVGGNQFGYVANPRGVEEFLQELPQPMFRDAGAETVREAKGVDTFLYRAMYKAHQARYGKQFLVGRQGIGDCVSWGWMHGIYVSQAIDWETGRLPEPPLLPATESIYGGSRVEARGRPGDGASPVGGWSDGSYGAAAAKFVRDWGVVYRQPQPTGVDLTAYSADRAKSWGAYGNGGEDDEGKLDTIAKRHPCAHVALVTTWAEACSAIEAGFPIPVASNQGFASVRDQQGYTAASGSWAHEMCFIAVRYAKNGSRADALLCLNSWGPNWISGPKWPADMPEGSFWVERPVVERMLSQRDSFAVGSVSGFAWRDLHNGNWLTPAPEDNVR